MNFIKPRRHVTQCEPSPSSEVDGYGNPVAEWVRSERLVYGWREASSREPGDVLDGRLVADVVLTAPTFPVSPLDQFEIPGYDRPLKVEGRPIVADNGPFGFSPGMRLNLRFVQQ